MSISNDINTDGNADGDNDTANGYIDDDIDTMRLMKIEMRIQRYECVNDMDNDCNAYAYIDNDDYAKDDSTEDINDKDKDINDKDKE